MHYSDASTAQRSALRFAIAAQQFTEAGAPDFDQIEQAEFAHIGAGNDVSRPERRQETIPLSHIAKGRVLPVQHSRPVLRLILPGQAEEFRRPAVQVAVGMVQSDHAGNVEADGRPEEALAPVGLFRPRSVVLRRNVVALKFGEPPSVRQLEIPVRVYLDHLERYSSRPRGQGIVKLRGRRRGRKLTRSQMVYR